MPFCNEEKLEKCIADLAERAKPSKNDIRYDRYVKYMNRFMRHFGGEQVYLVGSTGERSKLAYSKDNGDADFLIVSGKLEIPVENLIQRQYAPCYMWIEADTIYKERGCEIIQNKYVSANTLRDVKPELFTILRAIYLHVTSLQIDKRTDAGNDESDNVVNLKLPSKVGLQTLCYKNLKFDKGIKDISKHFSNLGSEQSRKSRPEGLRDLKIHNHDKKIYRRIYEIAKLAEPKRSMSNEGIGSLAQVFEEVLLRENVRFRYGDKECILYQRQIDCADHEETRETVFRATYKETKHKDFVPALMIKGQLECMDNWKKRVEKLQWPTEMIERIYNKQIFVVARTSPVYPNPEKDFSLSFNLPEKEMMLSASPTQTKVFLILKAFLKGVFENEHRLREKELALKTYHIKHLFFWLYEDRNVREMQSVPILLKQSLDSLKTVLEEKELRHYFVENNNMFVEFEDEDFEMLLKCVDKVMTEPVESLEYYIGLNSTDKREVYFTEEEMVCFLERMHDGGRNEYNDNFEEAMIDFQRGVNEGRDAEGSSPLIEAIVDTLKLGLDEVNVDIQMIRLLNGVLTYGQTDRTEIDTCKANRNIEDTVDLIVGLSEIIPNFGKLKHIGGKNGLRHILWGAFCGKRLVMDMNTTEQSLREQMLDAVRRYLSCSDDEENILCSELKYKSCCYILCKKEFSNLSDVRQV